MINEYVLDAATKSATDWVLTFPTKGFYVAAGSGAAVAPFTNNFATGGVGSCEPISFSYFNREEAFQAAQNQQFSPLPPNQQVAVCWEAQVLSILNASSSATTSGVLGSVNSLSVTVDGSFQNGWANLGFIGTGPTTGLSSAAGGVTVTNVATGVATAGQTANFKGLPVIGFMARTLNNGTLTCTSLGGTSGSCQGSYGSLFDHKYQVTVTP